MQEIKYRERQWEGGEHIEREGGGLWEELWNVKSLKLPRESKIISTSLNPKIKRHAALCF